MDDVELLEDASAVAEKIRKAAYETSAEGESLPEGLIGEQEDRSAGQADYVVVAEDDDGADGGREAIASQERAPTVAAEAGAPVTEAKEPEEIGGNAREGKLVRRGSAARRRSREMREGNRSGRVGEAFDPGSGIIVIASSGRTSSCDKLRDFVRHPLVLSSIDLSGNQSL